MVKIKRIYEKPDPQDGLRLLVDRWLKEIAQSDELRHWFGHDPARWQEFRTRYLCELEAKRLLLDEISDYVRKEPVTLLYAARDAEHNNAVVLEELLDK